MEGINKEEEKYVFVECDRKIREPRDNKQRKGGVTLYENKKEDGTNSEEISNTTKTGKTGNRAD